MFTQTLTGAWQFRQIGKQDWIPGNVPGSTYADLLAANRIPDPFVAENEKLVQWVADEDWEYCREFDASAELLTEEHIDLVCNGLDTIAELTLNGHRIGKTENMFHSYRWDIKEYLQAGTNTLSIIFRSPTKYAAYKQQQRKLPAIQNSGTAHIRKVQSHFGWDWGPTLPVSGISDEIEIEAWSAARIETVNIRQKYESDAVNLTIDTTIQTHSTKETQELILELIITAPTQEKTQKRIPIQAQKKNTQFLISNPQLWWPNGFGEQPLYQIEVRLLDGNSLLDQRRLQVGLRSITLCQEPDEWGKTFTFVVNDVPIFAKGANWIPVDSMATRFTAQQLEHLIRSAAEANMNMLRVWGGGYYESERFYDLCDRYGILIWQDFGFACAPYPLDEEPFLESVKLEVIQNVRRLRHRTCLALWCGNNEIEMMWGLWKRNKPLTKAYEKFFHHTLPDLINIEDPDRAYWPSSPSSGTFMKDTNADAQGDTHLWQVWHGFKPFKWYRTRYTRFCSEFGFEALPAFETIASFAQPQDYQIDSKVLLHHQRSAGGNDKMLYYLTDRFRIPRDFTDLVTVTQIIQAEAMRFGVEHWRRNRPRCSGALYWQLNDCWPVASWASIDYAGRWKALHYLARRFNAQVALSLEDADSRIGIFVANDLPQSWQGEIHWTLETLNGDVIQSGKESVQAEPLIATKIQALDFRAQLQKYDPRELVFTAELWQGPQYLSRQIALFAAEKKMVLPDPLLSADIDIKGEQLILHVTAERLARFVTLTLNSIDAIFSDNYFDLPAGKTERITVKCPTGWSEKQVRQALQIRSLASMEPAGTRFSDWLKHQTIKFKPQSLLVRTIFKFLS